MDKIDIKKLTNGITLITEHTEEVKTFSMGIFVKTGARDEFPHESGISHFIEHLMFKGTESRTAMEISETVDYEGGSINAYTSRDKTVYYIKLLSNKIDIALDILTDMFMNSSFLEENIEKERRVIIEEIKMYEDIPEEVVHDENIKFALTGVQSNSISGTPKSLYKIGRKEILNYLDERYIPSNIAISISGNIDKDYIFNELEKSMGKLEEKNYQRDIDTTFKINSGENLIKRNTNQIHLCFNTRSVSMFSELKYPVEIISNILGGSMSSRLFQKVREEKGLAYSIYSYTSMFSECGLFTVYAGTTKEDYKEVLGIIKDEFEDIKLNGISEMELKKAKNQFMSYMTFNLESTRGRMSRLANSYLIYGRVVPIEELIENIEKIKIEDIKKAAEFLFDEKYYSYTVLGDI